MAAPLKLISHKLCPYVQRAVIALTEKGVGFERIDIDLANKPDWFLAISPLGKTPVLQVGDTAIFESAVILEYLEETQPKPLHPADAADAAPSIARWIEFGSTVLNDIARLLRRAGRSNIQGQDLATRAAPCAARSARRSLAMVRRRKLLAGRRGVRSGVSLFRCVRRDRRLRNSRGQAETGALAQSAGSAAVGAHGCQRRLCGAASRISRPAKFLDITPAGSHRRLTSAVDAAAQRTLASRMSR